MTSVHIPFKGRRTSRGPTEPLSYSRMRLITHGTGLCIYPSKTLLRVIRERGKTCFTCEFKRNANGWFAILRGVDEGNGYLLRSYEKNRPHVSIPVNGSSLRIAEVENGSDGLCEDFVEADCIKFKVPESLSFSLENEVGEAR